MKRLFELFLIFSFMILLSGLSWGEDLLSRPYFTESREFFVTTPASGKWLSRDGFQIFIFDSALQTCGRSSEFFSKQVSDFKSSAGSFWSQLSSSIPGIQEYFHSKKVIISIDDFGRNSSFFRSFHLKNTPEIGESLISIDCHEMNGPAWKSLLAHEIIHAVLSEKKAPIWVEEMLAQHMEFQIRGGRPQEMMNLLRGASYLPSPISEIRPFQSLETYAMNFLLFEYMYEKMGKGFVLRALNPFVKEGSCGKEINLDQVICRIKIFNQNSELNLDWLNSQSLLQNFSMALMINRNDSRSMGFYQVPGWSGFGLNQNEILDPSKLKERGSFYRGNLSDITLPGHVSFESFSAFRINKTFNSYHIDFLDENFSGNNDKSDLVLILRH